jgi:hypothetical protein
MRSWPLARRDLLKRLGLGAACLPLLRAPRARAQARPRTKLLCVLAIQGYRQLYWKPAAGALAGQTLPSSSSPLEPHKNDLVFLSGLQHASGGGVTAYGTILWGLPNAIGGVYKTPNGKTLDQVVADAHPSAPGRDGSLAFGVQIDNPPRASLDLGASVCCWKGPGLPIVPEADPLAAYQRLFGAGPAGDPMAIARLRSQRKSMLDYVSGSLLRFAGRVGNEDKRYILGHLDSVRSLESRLLSGPGGGRCGQPPAALDLTLSENYPKVLQAETDVMITALGCGAISVATLQLADAAGNSINFGAFVPGVPASSTNNYKSPYRNWHDLGHNPVLDGQDQKAIVDRWWMQKFADLIARLKVEPDVDGGRLFDNTIMLWANPVEEGANHNSGAMPWMIACKAGGPLRTGQHIAAGGRPSSGVLAALAQALAVPNQPIGAPMPELLA